MGAVMCVSMTAPLRGFRGCAVREFTFVAQKPGCKGLRITTEACWGRCHTWERPILEAPFIHRHHHVCTYSHMRVLNVCQRRLPPLPLPRRPAVPLLQLLHAGHGVRDLLKAPPFSTTPLYTYM
ncbi:hypothetical protein OJAV_G00182470 [Oryzias javanicus]|uniref:Glycoprotein hormone subunit beta domain-containing protein n=1 Tax=Oryzias javanicus TaxID=123683 RepID=A0A437CCP8_ORYJA|nr:hypothetical protein OJAV_G00182470 [Oryzias javanicus]